MPQNCHQVLEDQGLLLYLEDQVDQHHHWSRLVQVVHEVLVPQLGRCNLVVQWDRTILLVQCCLEDLVVQADQGLLEVQSTLVVRLGHYFQWLPVHLEAQVCQGHL